MSLFIQEKEKLTDLVSEKGTRLIETLEIDTLYFIKRHLCYNALCCNNTILAPIKMGLKYFFAENFFSPRSSVAEPWLRNLLTGVQILLRPK